MERVFLKIDPDDPSPAELKGYFAEILESLDGNPRRLFLSVDATNARRSRVSVGYEDGEPVFSIEGRRSVRASFRGRWLPEIPVPFAFPRFGTAKLVLEPAGSNRIRVRKPTLFERLFP